MIKNASPTSASNNTQIKAADEPFEVSSSSMLQDAYEYATKAERPQTMLASVLKGPGATAARHVRDGLTTTPGISGVACVLGSVSTGVVVAGTAPVWASLLLVGGSGAALVGLVASTMMKAANLTREYNGVASALEFAVSNAEWVETLASAEARAAKGSREIAKSQEASARASIAELRAKLATQSQVLATAKDSAALEHQLLVQEIKSCKAAVKGEASARRAAHNSAKQAASLERHWVAAEQSALQATAAGRTLKKALTAAKTKNAALSAELVTRLAVLERVEADFERNRSESSLLVASLRLEAQRLRTDNADNESAWEVERGQMFAARESERLTTAAIRQNLGNQMALVEEAFRQLDGERQTFKEESAVERNRRIEQSLSLDKRGAKLDAGEQDFRARLGDLHLAEQALENKNRSAAALLKKARSEAAESSERVSEAIKESAAIVKKAWLNAQSLRGKAHAELSECQTECAVVLAEAVAQADSIVASARTRSFS